MKLHWVTRSSQSRAVNAEIFQSTLYNNGGNDGSVNLELQLSTSVIWSLLLCCSPPVEIWSSCARWARERGSEGETSSHVLHAAPLWWHSAQPQNYDASVTWHRSPHLCCTRVWRLAIKKKAIKFCAVPLCLLDPAMTFLGLFPFHQTCCSRGGWWELWGSLPPLNPRFLSPFNISSQHSYPVQPEQSSPQGRWVCSQHANRRAGGGPTTLYKHCTGPHTERMYFICLSGPP